MSKPANVVCDGDVCRIVEPSAAAPAAASTNAVLDLLGESLLGKGKDGANVPTSSITGPNKVIGLYFSAHWCGPCRAFTPALAKMFTDFKKNHARKDDFNIVFVSSDRDEASFNSYFADMPWLALPFDKDSTRKSKLSSKFKVQGIPTLVILDGATGQLLNGNGRAAVSEDPEGKSFPWKPESFAELIFGAELINKEGATFKADEVLKDKVKLIYFSAHWCGPCRGFTPELAKTYAKLKAAGKDFETVFVSSDRDWGSFKAYLDEMPWLALNYGDRALKTKLSNAFEVGGIPTLVILDENNKVITTSGRSMVMSDPEGKEFPWVPKPLALLNDGTVELVNEGAALVLYLGTDDKDAAAARAEQLLGSLAASSKAAAAAGTQDDINFLYGQSSDDLMGRVLSFAGVDVGADKGDGLLLLNIPSQCLYKYSGPITAEAAAEFIKGYLAGSLTKIPLGE